MLLASAYVRSTPDQSHLVADVSGQGVSALGRAAPYLASTLSRARDPFVLMLDDLHELRSPACQDVLSVVVSGIPRGSQLVTASRAEQSHLPRLRASGDTLEMHAPDLALDAAGAEQIFSHGERSADLGAGYRRHETDRGLARRPPARRDDRPPARGGSGSVSGDDRFVADYLYREALSRLDQRTQRFLRRTAVLDQLTGPLCDAVLDDSGSQEMLQSSRPRTPS